MNVAEEDEHDDINNVEAEVMMDQDPGAAAEALQAHHDVPEDQRHHQDLPDVDDEDMQSPPEQQAHQAPVRAGLLLRHASQSSLDESSQKFGGKGGEHKRPPYKNLSHPGKALDGMNSMRLSGMLCDVTLVADNTEIPAHKVSDGAHSQEHV